MKSMKSFAKLLKAVTIMVAVIASGCVSTNKLPEASAGFVPKMTYPLAYDAAWSKVMSALGANSIAVASSSKDSGQISTDYIEGSHTMILDMVQDSRYKFNIFVNKVSATETAINIKPVTEVASSSGSGGSSTYRDVTSQNVKVANKVRDWLYEKIEKSM